jgi:hypothetical protein
MKKNVRWPAAAADNFNIGKSKAKLLMKKLMLKLRLKMLQV